MNLLVSSGVTVAYVSSIALLALAATQHPANDRDGDITTYFDSVVFLAMFLLVGSVVFLVLLKSQADRVQSVPGSLQQE
jgi:Cu+-exporting ATPase